MVLFLGRKTSISVNTLPHCDSPVEAKHMNWNIVRCAKPQMTEHTMKHVVGTKSGSNPFV